jgi:hypothetical protein
MSPQITANEPNRFGMTKILEKRMILRVEISADAAGNTYVTVMSTLRMAIDVTRTVILGVTTCGLLALVFVPLIYLKYSRWQNATNKAVALLKADLG